MINYIQLAITKEQLLSGQDTQKFVTEFPKLVNLLSIGIPEVKIELPLSNMNKSEIIEKGNALGLTFEETWSCYYSYSEHCGICYGCIVRKKGFQESKVKDPTIYKDGK